MVMTRVCMAVLFTPSWFRAPMHREMAEVAPAPIPLDKPTSIMKRGVTKPTAARAFPPNPDTQMASTRL